MGDQGDDQGSFVDRYESKMNSWHPAQIDSRKVTVRQAVIAHSQVHNSTTRQQTDCRETVTTMTHSENHQSNSNMVRSELNVEVKGIRESPLTPTMTPKVVSDTVRTVFSRNISGSSSSTEDNSAVPVSVEADATVFEDRQPTEVVEGGAWEYRRKTTESHYISKTYNVDPRDSPSKSVTAIQNVTFKCRKQLDIGTPHGHPETAAAAEENHREHEHLRFVDRYEEVITPDAPAVLASPDYSSASQQFLYDEPSSESDEADKLKSAREDVQQMIESSYLVSDITDVIDDHEMDPRSATASELELSQRELLGRDVEIDFASTQMSQSEATLEQQAIWQTANPPNNRSLDKDSPKRLTYSPGLAIRSYALEELAEKKHTKESPDSIENKADSIKFDFHSSQVDPDGGSSVDNMVIPTVFQSSEASQSSLQPTSANSIHYEAPQGTMPLDHSFVSQTMAYGVQSMDEDELREGEDKLESLVDITAGYRFHDVGMMMDLEEGICNPAFDASDDPVTDEFDGPSRQFDSQDRASLQMAANAESTWNAPQLMSSSSAASLQSAPSLLASPPSAYDAYNQEGKTRPHSESSFNISPSSISSSSIVASEQPVVLKATAPTQTCPPTVTSKRDGQVPAPVAKVSGPPIQVTRRFTVTKKFEAALKSLGGRLTSESFAIDVYFDTPAFDLTQADAWLRTHNGKWQFHANFSTMFDSGGEKCRYAETEGAEGLLAKVTSVLKKSSSSCSVTPDQVGHSVTSFVQKSGLREFVRYTTTVRTYHWGQMVIELVMPEYGFWTGTVTSSAPCKAQTHKVVGGIEDMWAKTGVSALSLVSLS